jgi:single-strand DNA-binding protein
MNKVILIGNLTRDPELSTIPSGTNVCKFSIAVNRKYAGADGQRDTDFFNITAWRGLGENCAKFLKKGSKVCATGQIQTRTYEQDGVKKYAIDIIADEVEFLSPKGNSVGDTGDIALQPVTDDSLPF